MSDSVSSLREAVNDPEQRLRLAELLAIVSLLRRCIIDHSYRLSDDMICPMRFTAFGQKTIDSCMKAHSRLRPNDVKMAVFLVTVCTDGMMVDLSTDLEALRQQISREILRGKIKFPYIFGRELHDTAAKLFPARTRLDNRQTIQLLNQLPVGVFQEGRTVVGPYGCTYSDVPRQAGSTVYVPGYRCPEESCTSIHRLELSTADSSIQKAEKLLRQFMEKNYSQSVDEHLPLLSRAITLEVVPTASFPTTNLIDVLSDGFSEEELRVIIDHLMRRTFKREGRKIDISKRLGAAIVNPSDFVKTLQRPQLMQIALLHSDSDLIGAIDEVISQGQLQLKEYEVRVSRVRRWDRESKFPHAEIGPLGVRFTSSPSSRLVADRMLRLLHLVYYESEFWDAGDLAYAIEAPNGLSDGELLNRAIRDYTVSELFSKLVMLNRRAVGIASRELNLFDSDGLPRDQLLERFQWKIGEPSVVAFPDLFRIDEYLARVKEANDEGAEEDVIRAAASTLFTATEDALNRALTFSIWALTIDHYLSRDGFVYDPLIDRSIVSFIETHAPTSDPDFRLKTEQGNTLMPLGAGFARLAKSLRSLDEAAHVRPMKDIPVQSIASSRPFAYPFTMMFFNLARQARSDVLTALQAIGRHAQNEDVIDSRNWTAHGDRPFPGTVRVRNALDHISNLRDYLHTTGLYPRLYELVNLSRDGLGREQLVYVSEEESLTIFRPGWAITPRIPAGQARLLFMPVANTESSGPLRFRLKPRPGEDPYWEGWPKRWPRTSGYSEEEHTFTDGSVLTEAG